VSFAKKSAKRWVVNLLHSLASGYHFLESFLPFGSILEKYEQSLSEQTDQTQLVFIPPVALE